VTKKSPWAKPPRPFEDTPVQENACPSCGHGVNGAMSAGQGARPEPGDWAVCIRCAAVSKYGADLRLVALTEAEHEEAMSDADVTKSVAIIKRMQERE
jgi:hypothetical protein